MGASSLTAGGKILLPLLELLESSEFSEIVTSLRLVLLAQGLPEATRRPQCGLQRLFPPKIAFADWKVLVTSVTLLVHVGSFRPAMHVGSFTTWDIRGFSQPRDTHA